MGIVETIILFVVILLSVTATYKWLPYRPLSKTKPRFTLFPKYHTTIQWSKELADVAEELEKYGFELRSKNQDKLILHRGSLLGDFSVKLLKLKCIVSPSENDSLSITLEAGWMIAFDTGDLWTFTTELKQKLMAKSE